MCQNLTGANAYFYSPDAQNVSLRSNVVNDNMLDEILVVKNRTNDPYNCSYPMDVNWTHNEQIRSKLSSIQCAFIFEDGASNCITDKINIVFAGMNRSNLKLILILIISLRHLFVINRGLVAFYSLLMLHNFTIPKLYYPDSHCDNRTKITPSDVLHVPKGESTTVSCSSPCILNGSRITNVFFISPSDGRPIVGRVNFTESDEVCIYSMEIKDSGTRTKLDSLYCDFTYSSIYLESCKTAVILVKSSDTGILYVYVYVPCYTHYVTCVRYTYVLQVWITLLMIIILCSVYGGLSSTRRKTDFMHVLGDREIFSSSTLSLFY